MYYDTLDYRQVRGVKIYLERYSRRVPVGELKHEDGKYIFTYYETYLKYQKAIPLGVEFPLTKQYFESETIFESFWDRIPSKGNPAYSEYCKQFNISPEENNILVLLVTIGRKGPSSFIFEPIWNDSFTGKELKLFRNKLNLSTREFAAAFGISQATIVRIENNKASGSEVLKLLEIFSKFPDSAIYYAKKYGSGLHSMVKEDLINRLKMDILTTEEFDATLIAVEELQKVEWGREMLANKSCNLSINDKLADFQDKKKHKALSDTDNIRGTLVEAQFAAAIKRAELAAEYEYSKQAGLAAGYEYTVGTENKSIDFNIDDSQGASKAKWLVELTSLRASTAIKENTITDGNVTFYQSTTTPWDDYNSPEVRDINKTQNAILHKVDKFPEKKKDTYNIIIVDVRSFNSGSSDFTDYINILYGSKDLPDEYKKWWIKKNKQRSLIIGILDPDYPVTEDKRHLHQGLLSKIDAIGFINEKTFDQGKMNSKIILYANPKSNTEKIRELWPLHKS
jgi:HipA-like protein